MIFVTVGTHHQPFDRLLRALDTLDTSEMVVQYGPGKPPSGAARAEEFMPFDAILAALREADVVITHAGVGSILCATREGHTPLVVPRRHDLGEHVDDHQVELTHALEARNSVVAVWDTGLLADLIASAPPRRLPVDAIEPPLCGRVRAAIFGDATLPTER